MNRFVRTLRNSLAIGLIASIAGITGSSAMASSHMDAPLITLDPAANTTDVYAFVQQEGGTKVLVTALGVYPHEEPGIGPNKYNFDDDVLYEIHVATGNDVAGGRAHHRYGTSGTTRAARRSLSIIIFVYFRLRPRPIHGTRQELRASGY